MSYLLMCPFCLSYGTKGVCPNRYLVSPRVDPKGGGTRPVRIQRSSEGGKPALRVNAQPGSYITVRYPQIDHKCGFPFAGKRNKLQVIVLKRTMYLCTKAAAQANNQSDYLSTTHVLFGEAGRHKGAVGGAGGGVPSR